MNAKFGMIASNNPILDSEDYEEMRSRNEDTEAIYEVNKLKDQTNFHNLQFIDRFLLLWLCFG